MNVLPFGGWRRIWTRLTARRGALRRRRRSHVSPIPAEVERLESRALLTVTYHGGALLTHVEVQAVYLGSDWQTNSSLHGQAGQLDQFLSMVVNSSYMDMLTSAGYGVGRGTATAGVVDNSTLNKTTGITDAQIEGDVQAMIASGQLQAPDANRLYVVYVEPGVVIHLGSDASNTTFLGYHGAYAGTTAAHQTADIHYAVISYPGAPNFTASSQGFSSNLDELTSVSSHELAEAVTDPNVNYKTLSWYDDQYNGEIGDLAEGHYTVLSGFLVQDLVNQNDQIIAPSTTPPTTLSAPNLTASATSATTAQLAWNAVSGAQGYRVFWVSGSQTTLLGTVGAATTSVQITRLTPGTTASFKVEAYNATATADSKVVSVQMPSAAHLAAPQLSVKALSATSAQLSWNSVSGAQGYRVYWMNGTHKVLLGTVGAGTTSVLVSGLTPGAQAKFMIEAYNSTSVADSAWVSVAMPAHQQSHELPLFSLGWPLLWRVRP